MKRARISDWVRTRRYDEPSKDLVRSSLRQSCPDCIIATHGYSFREGQECEPAKHAPDAEPGKCVTGAGAHTASRNEKRFAVTHPRWEPYARIGPVRFCAGGAQ